ncbi:MAG: hypothetical protein HY286_05070 [Planctomycetes bacterium]|nr:hypothetical protein [Planctomycetota bacterium]
MTDEDPKLVDQFVQKFKPTYPIVIIKNKDFDVALKVEFFPTGAALDPGGNLIFSGGAAEAEQKVMAALASAKKGRVVPEKFAPVMASLRARKLSQAYADIKKISGADKAWTERFTKFLESEADSSLTSAKKANDDGFIYEAVRLVQTVAKAAPPFPTTKDAAEFLKSLESNAKFKSELSGGEKYEKAHEFETAKEYTKAVAVYAELIKSCPGTKIADTAKKHAQELVDQGMPGYKSECAACQKAKKACDKHKENVKL